MPGQIRQRPPGGAEFFEETQPLREEPDLSPQVRNPARRGGRDKNRFIINVLHTYPTVFWQRRRD